MAIVMPTIEAISTPAAMAPAPYAKISFDKYQRKTRTDQDDGCSRREDRRQECREKERAGQGDRQGEQRFLQPGNLSLEVGDLDFKILDLLGVLFLLTVGPVREGASECGELICEIVHIRLQHVRFFFDTVRFL